MRQFTIGRLRGGFCVSWHEDGKRRRYSLKARERKEAEAEALDVIQRETTPKGDLTVAAIWQAYCNENADKPIATTMSYTGKAVLPVFGAYRPEQITIDLCRNYTTIRSEKNIKLGSIWTELGHLRIVVNWAVKRRLIEFAPHIERPQKPTPKERFLSDDEVQKLLTVDCQPHIKLATILMLTTAGRIGSILELTWDRVDFERNQINLRTAQSATRKGRAIVPMNPMSRAALISAKDAALTVHVVEWAGKPVKSIKKGFANACKLAGLSQVSPHVLRHTAGVKMAESGIPMQKISQYLGHSSIAVTESVYARYAPDHLTDAAEVLNFMSGPVSRNKMQNQ